MIGKLKGVIDSASGNQIIIDVQGVGYLVAASAQTLHQAGGIGATTALWIETQVREDAINLFGFATEAERDWFRLLTTVQGVGAKSALSILGLFTPERLAQIIAAQDKSAITAADGVGPKLALRLITELKDKVAGIALPTAAAARVASAVATGGVSEDAVSALLHLGYKRLEAFAAVSAAAGKLGEGAGLDALIRAALGELSQKDKNA